MSTHANHNHERPWPVRAATYFLFGQMAGLLAIGLFNFLTTDLTQLNEPRIVLSNVLFALTNSIVFSALALLALVAAVNFWAARPLAWPSAILIQGLILLVALVIYFSSPVFYAYLMMGSAIFMTAYLHHPDIRTLYSQAGDEHNQ